MHPAPGSRIEFPITKYVLYRTYSIYKKKVQNFPGGKWHHDSKNAPCCMMLISLYKQYCHRLQFHEDKKLT